jgi:transposase
MTSLPTMDVSNLPDDLMLCHQVIRELHDAVHQVQRENAQLNHRLQQLLRARYGPRAERMDPAQMLLFAREILEQEAPESAREPESPEEATCPPRRKGHGRRPLPKDLPRKRVVHDLSLEEQTCPCCGEPRTKISEETSEQLEFVPASIYVIEHVRPKYVCKRCEGNVAIGEKPLQPIEKGLAGPGLLAHVITSNYGDHLPLYRQEPILARHGIEITRSTTCGWMAACAELLTPLYDLMKRRIQASKVIHTDDTPVPVQDKDRNKTRPGRVWVYVGDKDHPFTVFDYTPSRSRDGPVAFLDGFQGYLQADAFSGYDAIYAGGKVIEVACWAHVRRKFVEAEKTDPQRAYTAVAMIRLLYDVESEAKDLDAETRRALRQEKSLPRLDQIEAWLEKEKSEVLPKSPMGEAINHALSNWVALTVYTRDGDLAIDNNAAENALQACYAEFPCLCGIYSTCFVRWCVDSDDVQGDGGPCLVAFQGTIAVLPRPKSTCREPWSFHEEAETWESAHYCSFCRSWPLPTAGTPRRSGTSARRGASTG